MANEIMNEEFKKTLEDFFNSPVKVYECGEEKPARIQDRPFIKTLPDGRTVYLQKTPETKNAASFALSLDAPIAGGSIETETENSKFLADIEKRFRAVKPNAQMIIIDPDVVRGRYALDESADKSLLTSFYKYLHGRMEEDGVARAIPLQGDDYYELMGASITGNSPLSLSVPVKGLGQYAIVISTQPDMPTHDMFTAIPGSKIRMGNEEIGKDQVRSMILYHELGHALDTRNNSAKTKAEQILARHRTECVADAHAVLQLARDQGNTKMGKLVGDIRIDNTVQGLSYIQKVLQRMYGGGRGIEEKKDKTKRTPDFKMNDLSEMLRDGYENQSFFASPELKAFVKETASQNNAVPKAPQEPTSKDVINQLAGSAQIFKVVDVLGSIASYTTSFTADAAVKIADEKLADGSLKQMTDKEVHKLAEKIVDDNSFSMERISNLVMGMVTGQPPADLQTIIGRYDEAKKRFPRDPEAEEKMVMQQMGFPVPEPRLSNKEVVELNKWFRRELPEKIEGKGADKSAVVDIVANEKDSARAKDSLFNEYKIAIMNEIFLNNPDHAVEKAKSFGTVRETLRTIETKKVEETGAAAVSSFISNELKEIEFGQKAVELAGNRDISAMTPEAFAKSVTTESKNLKKLFEAEKQSQALAFAIRKDSEAWNIVQTVPGLAERIEEKAKQKHPVWLEGVHLNLGGKNKNEVAMSKAEIDEQKKVLAHYSLASKKVSETLSKKLTNELSKQLNEEKTGRRKATKVSKDKENKYEPNGDIQWNYLKNSMSKGK